jgi:phosphoribosylglycinamide formyltransferase 1
LSFDCEMDPSTRHSFKKLAPTSSVRLVTAIVPRVADPPANSLRDPLPIAVLVSGAGTNLQALLDAVHGREVQIAAVASSVPGARALERAAASGIPTAVFARSQYPDRAGRDEALADWLLERGARLVVLAGYMELLGAPFLERFPAGVINVHPSLLPSFPGLEAVEQALAYGVKVFGATVHFVDAGVDSGPVISQRAIELPQARDPEEVRDALRPLEHALLTEAVRLFALGALRPDPLTPRRITIDVVDG